MFVWRSPGCPDSPFRGHWLLCEVGEPLVLGEEPFGHREGGDSVVHGHLDHGLGEVLPHGYILVVEPLRAVGADFPRLLATLTHGHGWERRRNPGSG